MEVLLKKAAYEDKSVLRQLMELYAYDFSEFTGWEINANGYYGYRYFDHYWTEDDRYPYFIMADGQIVGFVLVNSYTSHIKNGHAIAEFFVMRKYRRGGVGKKAAFLAFDAHPGMWEVNEMAQNIAAQKFWVNVIGEYTAGDFGVHEVMMGDSPGTGQHFHTDAKKL